MSNSHLARTRSLKRSWLVKLLRLDETPEERRFCVEPLERRELMAADLTDFLGSNSNPNTASNSAFYSQTQDPLALSTQAEGESAPDLVAFAQALRDAGVTIYGAAWSTATSDQLRLFQDGAPFLDFVEVTNADQTPNTVGTAEGITQASQYPTWVFQNNVRHTGAMTLQEVSTAAGISIPTSSNPFLNTIGNQDVQINSPLAVPVDAYDANGQPLTITVTSSNPSAVQAEVIQGGRSARVSTNYGDMVFRLYEAEASRATAQFIALAQSGFYNSSNANNMTFHRIINGFVIQGGDPTGTGGGGSNLGDFDDIFNVNLQHNRSGVLSYAKSTDDTNDSQFFITEAATPSLDSNHSIFGQLIEGESVREAISNTQTNTSNKPTHDVIINSVTIFNDTENGLLRLKAVGAAGSSSTITVTVTDSEGNATSRSFTATARTKSFNDGPFLNDFNDEITTSVGQAATVQLSSQDAEGDAVKYFVNPPVSGGVQYQASVTSAGLVTITPPAGFIGTFNVLVGVQAPSVTTGSDPADTQTIKVTVQDTRPPAPTGIDLVDGSDSGVSNSDNITNATSLSFTVSGTQAGANVELLRDGQVIGSQVATGTTTTITTTAITSPGNYTLTSRQTLNSQTSLLSTSLSLTFDNTAPTQISASLLPSTAVVGTNLNANLTQPEENSGLRYAFTTAPSGATIDQTTGVITWTPTTAQVGAQAFTLTLTDRAGNVTTQNFSVAVSLPPLASITVSFVDMNGNAITEIGTGQQFKVRLTAADLRPEDAEGVFQAYLDLLYNQALVQLSGSTPIAYPNGFDLSRTGSTTTAGLINELGAARTSGTPTGSAPIVFAEVTMTALGPGQAIFTAESADDTGSEFAVYDSTPDQNNQFDSVIPVARIKFNSASLAIGRTFEAVDDSYNVNENSGETTLAVLQNETIRTGGSLANLTIVSVSTPNAGGTVTISGNSLIYKPAPGYSGAESFTYTVRDASGAEDTATVSILVQDVNVPPVATNDNFTAALNSSGNQLDVLANDNTGSDTGETLTISAVGTTSNQGTVTISSDGKRLVYTPKAGFNGLETFTYTINDGRGGTATATVTVDVGASGPPPTAVSDSFTVAEDAPSSNFDVIANDIPSTSGETLTIDNVTSSQGGTVTVATGGRSINYRPAANFNGTEIVVYRLVGSGGGRAFGTVTFTVTAVNDPPNAVDDTFTVPSLPNQTLNVLANDTNVDTGETLTIAAVSAIPAAQGTLVVSADGKSLLYNPPSSNFNGTITFTYTLSDGTNLTDTATVTLNVRNYTPRAIGGWVSGQLGYNGTNLSGLSVTISGTSFTGDAITRTVTTDAQGGFKTSDLPPGTYNVTVNSLAFRGGSSVPLTIVSNQNDGDSVSNVLLINDILPQYVSFRDFLGSVSGQGFSVAAQPGSTQQWIVTNGAWRGFKSITASLSADSSQLTIRTTTNANTVNTQTVNVNNNKLVSVRQKEGNILYLQILGEPGAFNLPTPSAADIQANSPGANAVRASALAAMSTSSTSSQAATDLALQDLGSGEGEDSDKNSQLTDFFGSSQLENDLD